MQDKQKIAIVGGGIAGLSLGFQFYKKNIPFEIITKKENHSSIIAAGLMIPIVFRRTTKSWNIDQYLPIARNYYQEIEECLQTKLWHNIPVRRSFSHQQEADDWKKRMVTDEFKAYLGEMNSPCSKKIYQEYGTGIVKNAAWIDTNSLMDKLQSFFKEKGMLKYESFSYDRLSTYQSNYTKIVFCEGYEMIHNPYFNHLPLDPTKGQVLVVHSDEIPETESINRKCFVLPIGNQLFKVGSTYEWSNTTLNTTEEAKNSLVNNLKDLIDAKFEVVEQLAGVRPTVKDRRPLLGIHPTERNLYVFNGFGTKGYLLAPIMSEYMSEFVIGQKELPIEVDIQRFEK